MHSSEKAYWKHAKDKEAVLISWKIEMKLTELEKDVIVAITENEYSDIPGDHVWSWSVADNCKITHKDQVSGVVSSLVKKGLTKCYEEGKDSTIHLTDAGIKVYRRIKGK